MKTQSVSLSVPPSANALWRVVRTRRGKASVTLQSRYRDWLDGSIILLRLGMEKVARYPVAVDVVVHPGNGWAVSRDLDNALKPVLDALRKSGRIEDDRGEFVSECRIRLGEPRERASVVVSVVEEE